MVNKILPRIVGRLISKASTFLSLLVESSFWYITDVLMSILAKYFGDRPL